MKLLAAHGNVTRSSATTTRSVYQWRGADIRNMLDFNRDYPQARIDFASRRTIVRPAASSGLRNTVIAANTQRLGKTLRSTKERGEAVTAIRALDERDEAAAIAEEIVARRRREQDLALRDFAILYRTNSQSRAFEEAMRRQGIPYRLVGAIRFYDRREIRDLMSYTQAHRKPRRDDEAFRRDRSCRAAASAKTVIALAGRRRG